MKFIVVITSKFSLICTKLGEYFFLALELIFFHTCRDVFDISLKCISLESQISTNLPKIRFKKKIYQTFQTAPMIASEVMFPYQKKRTIFSIQIKIVKHIFNLAKIESCQVISFNTYQLLEFQFILFGF